MGLILRLSELACLDQISSSLVNSRRAVSSRAALPGSKGCGVGLEISGNMHKNLMQEQEDDPSDRAGRVTSAFY
jgi:hypothetical protein